MRDDDKATGPEPDAGIDRDPPPDIEASTGDDGQMTPARDPEPIAEAIEAPEDSGSAGSAAGAAFGPSDRESDPHSREEESNREIPQVDPRTAAGDAARAEADHGGPSASSRHVKSGAGALTLGALGVVFGDIGTSPLYAMKEVFDGPQKIAPDPTRIYGVLSLIFWALMIIVTIKYVLLIMRVSNDGEGGIMALIALMLRAARRSRSVRFPLVALGIFGASLFYGDGMITPAISVLSAVEGLRVAEPSLGSFVLPIAITILTSLFVVQRYGTGLVGAAFGPVTALWFLAIGGFGLREVITEPSIIRVLSPSYGISFLAHQPGTAFIALGSVVLAVTGAEALYADMGHFGRPAISRAWFLLVLPALMLQYMGQGALVMRDHSAVASPFYGLIPDRLRIPMVILATMATVIASQAVISGAFSVTRQAVQMGFLPRLRIVHTSSRQMGQIYVPVVNWGIFVAVIALVLGFRSSSNLASAYGIAVTGTLAIDTILFFVVAHLLFRRPVWVAVSGAVTLLIVDLGFFAANVPKITHGGWFPLAIATIVFTTLMTWRAGRLLLRERMVTDEVPISQLLADVERRQLARVPGTAVFLTATGPDAPRSLIQNVEHNRVLHEHVVLFTIRVEGRPSVPDAERLRVTDLAPGVVRIEGHYGFQDVSDIPAALRLAQASGVDIDAEDASYFINRVSLTTGRASGLARWRKRLFRALNLNARDAAEYFQLPADRVVEMGSRVEL